MPIPPPQPDQAVSAELTALLGLLDHGVLVLDEQYRVTHANDAFVSLCGVGVAPHMLSGTTMPAGPATLRSAYQEPTDAAGRCRATLAGGRPVRDQRHPMTAGRIVAHDYAPITASASTVGHLWVLRDVTGQAASGLDSAGHSGPAAHPEAAHPKAAHPEAARLAATIAHELRTPATSVAAFVELLTDTDTDGRRRAVAAIDRNAARLLLLAADLLLLSDLDAATDTPGDALVDLPALVRRAAADADLPITVRSEPGPPVVGDPALLRQAVAAALTVATALAAEPTTDRPTPESAADHPTPKSAADHPTPKSAADHPTPESAADRPTPESVVNHTAAGVQVDAAHSADGWTVTATANVGVPVTPERLYAVRVPHPDDVESTRSAALALLLARSITASHGGEFKTSGSAARHTVTLRLPTS